MIPSVNFWVSRHCSCHVFAMDLLSEVKFPICCFCTTSGSRTIDGRRGFRCCTADRRAGDRQTLVAVLGIWVASEVDVILVVEGMKLCGEERGWMRIGMRHRLGRIVRLVLSTTQIIRLQRVGRSARRGRVVPGGLVRKCCKSRGIGIEEGWRESEVGSGLGSWIHVVCRMPHIGDFLILHFIRLFLEMMLRGIDGGEMLFLESGHKVRRGTSSRFLGAVGKVSGHPGRRGGTGW
jgi:hypothetical protein